MELHTGSCRHQTGKEQPAGVTGRYKYPAQEYDTAYLEKLCDIWYQTGSFEQVSDFMKKATNISKSTCIAKEGSNSANDSSAHGGRSRDAGSASDEGSGGCRPGRTNRTLPNSETAVSPDKYGHKKSNSASASSHASASIPANASAVPIIASNYNIDEYDLEDGGFYCNLRTATAEEFFLTNFKRDDSYQSFPSTSERNDSASDSYEQSVVTNGLVFNDNQLSDLVLTDRKHCKNESASVGLSNGVLQSEGHGEMSLMEASPPLAGLPIDGFSMVGNEPVGGPPIVNTCALRETIDTDFHLASAVSRGVSRAIDRSELLPSPSLPSPLLRDPTDLSDPRSYYYATILGLNKNEDTKDTQDQIEMSTEISRGASKTSDFKSSDGNRDASNESMFPPREQEQVPELPVVDDPKTIRMRAEIVPDHIIPHDHSIIPHEHREHWSESFQELHEIHEAGGYHPTTQLAQNQLAAEFQGELHPAAYDAYTYHEGHRGAEATIGLSMPLPDTDWKTDAESFQPGAISHTTRTDATIQPPVLASGNHGSSQQAAPHQHSAGHQHAAAHHRHRDQPPNHGSEFFRSQTQPSTTISADLRRDDDLRHDDYDRPTHMASSYGDIQYDHEPLVKHISPVRRDDHYETHNNTELHTECREDHYSQKRRDAPGEEHDSQERDGSGKRSSTGKGDLDRSMTVHSAATTSSSQHVRDPAHTRALSSSSTDTSGLSSVALARTNSREERVHTPPRGGKDGKDEGSVPGKGSQERYTNVAKASHERYTDVARGSDADRGKGTPPSDVAKGPQPQDTSKGDADKGTYKGPSYPDYRRGSYEKGMYPRDKRGKDACGRELSGKEHHGKHHYGKDYGKDRYARDTYVRDGYGKSTHEKHGFEKGWHNTNLHDNWYDKSRDEKGSFYDRYAANPEKGFQKGGKKGYDSQYRGAGHDHSRDHLGAHLHADPYGKYGAQNHLHNVMLGKMGKGSFSGYATPRSSVPPNPIRHAMGQGMHDMPGMTRSIHGKDHSVPCRRNSVRDILMSGSLAVPAAGNLAAQAALASLHGTPTLDGTPTLKTASLQGTPNFNTNPPSFQSTPLSDPLAAPLVAAANHAAAKAAAANAVAKAAAAKAVAAKVAAVKAVAANAAANAAAVNPLAQHAAELLCRQQQAAGPGIAGKGAVAIPAALKGGKNIVGKNGKGYSEPKEHLALSKGILSFPNGNIRCSPIIQEQMGIWMRKNKRKELDCNGCLYILSYLINKHFHKVDPDISNDTCWSLVWEIAVYMQTKQIQSNSRIWCMMASAVERYKPERTPELFYETLLSQYYTFSSPMTGYYNAHADASLIRLMCFCGFMDDAYNLLSSRRGSYKVGSHNFQWRFLLYQGLLDYSAVHNKEIPELAEKCEMIERHIRLWIEEDGVDNVEDISKGRTVRRDVTKQKYFIGVPKATNTHSRMRGIIRKRESDDSD